LLASRGAKEGLQKVFRSEKPRAVLLYLALLFIFHAPVVFLGKSLQAPLMQPYGLVNGFPYGYEGRLPSDSFNIDLATPAYYEWPVNKLVGDIYKNGELPLWNPFQAAGVPLGAQYSTRAFFPYQILQDISPVWTWDFFLLGRPLIAAFFTFLFLRLLGLGPVSAFTGGLVYMFSGVFTWFLNLEQFSNSASVLPILLYCSERLVNGKEGKRGKGRETAFLGVAFGLAFLAGQPEIAAYSFLLAGSYFVLRLVTLRAGALGRALRFAASFALGFALAAPLLLPFIGYMYDSFHLHEPGKEVGVADPVKYRHAIELLSPGFSEIRQANNPVVFDEEVNGERFFFRALPANGNWDYLGGYTGITAFFIALAGLIAALLDRGSRWRAPALFFFSFGLAIVLKNFGLKPFIWFGQLPIFEQVWSQRWAGPAWVFSLSVSAAIGLQALTDAGAAARKKGYAAGASFVIALGLFIHMYVFNLLRTREVVSRYAPGEGIFGSIGFLVGQFPFFGPAMILSPAVTIAFLLFALLAVLFILKKERGAYGVAALIFLELWWAMPRGYDYYWLWLKCAPLSVGLAGAAAFALGRVRTGAALFAAFLAAFATFDYLAPRGLPERHDPFAEPPPYVEFIKERAGENYRAMGFDGMLFPNYAGAVGVHDIRYITSLSVASFQELRQRYLHPEGYHIFSLWFTGKDFKDAPTTHKDSFLANTPYYSLLGVKYLILPPGGEIGASNLNRVYEGPDAWVYENPFALPRAFVVHEIRPASSNKEALEELSRIDFTREAVVEGTAPSDIGQGQGQGQGSRAEVVRSGANYVEVKAVLGASGLLVLSDTYHHGWRAFERGKQIEVHRVNATMRGVFLPAGERLVTFTYSPKGFTAGCVLFFLGAAAAALLILRKERR